MKVFAALSQRGQESRKTLTYREDKHRLVFHKSIYLILLKGVLKRRFPVFHKFSPIFPRFRPSKYKEKGSSHLDTPLGTYCKRFFLFHPQPLINIELL